MGQFLVRNRKNRRFRHGTALLVDSLRSLVEGYAIGVIPAVLRNNRQVGLSFEIPYR